MKQITKGENIAIPQLQVRVDLGWLPHRVGRMDVDAFAIPLSSQKSNQNSGVSYYLNKNLFTDCLIFEQGSFLIDLEHLPAWVEFVEFVLILNFTDTASYTFGDAQKAALEIEGITRFEVSLVGEMSRSFIMGELYKKNGVWKFKAVAQGFREGRSSLFEKYSILPNDMLQLPHPDSALANVELRRFTLDKRIEKIKEKDNDLADIIQSLSFKIKKQNLLVKRAKVALVLDISSSTASLYRSGKMQRLAERALAVGFCFDDNAEIDVFLFGDNAYNFGAIGASNFKGFATDVLKNYSFETNTRYGGAIKKVCEFYKKQRDWGAIPVYVMFVTDGGTQDAPASKQLLVESSAEPIFWSFMAIGHGQPLGEDEAEEVTEHVLGSANPNGFEFLSVMEYLPEKMVKNSNFFIVDDPSLVSDEELFDNLMKNYAEWQEASVALNILKEET